MDIEAMHQLIRVLKAVPPEHFDMREVAALAQPPRGKVVTAADLHTCGSAACAVGYMAADPWFQERGLHLLGSRTYRNVDEDKAAHILGLEGGEIDLIFVAEHPLVSDLDMAKITPTQMVAVVEAMIADHLAGRPLDSDEAARRDRLGDDE